jgi:hypothetical protein
LRRARVGESLFRRASIAGRLKVSMANCPIGLSAMVFGPQRRAVCDGRAEVIPLFVRVRCRRWPEKLALSEELPSSADTATRYLHNQTDVTTDTWQRLKTPLQYRSPISNLVGKGWISKRRGVRTFDSVAQFGWTDPPQGISEPALPSPGPVSNIE